MQNNNFECSNKKKKKEIEKGWHYLHFLVQIFRTAFTSNSWKRLVRMQQSILDLWKKPCFSGLTLPTQGFLGLPLLVMMPGFTLLMSYIFNTFNALQLQLKPVSLENSKQNLQQYDIKCRVSPASTYLGAKEGFILT